MTLLSKDCAKFMSLFKSSRVKILYHFETKNRKLPCTVAPDCVVGGVAVSTDHWTMDH